MKILLALLLFSSCITPESTVGLRDALPRVTPLKDTVCIEESYDWFRHRPALHVHCIHDYK